MNKLQILQLLIDADICNGNIFKNFAPSGTPLPHGRWSTITTVKASDLQSDVAWEIRFDLSIWAKTHEELEVIANEIRLAFRFHGRELSVSDSYESETSYHRMEYYWYFIETN